MTLFIKRTAPALALLGLGLASCQPDIENPSASAGSVDFSSYVAVGNSLTSGYSDGGLYNEAQATSYPALLAQQFAKTGKGPANFVQPSFDAAKSDGSGYIKLLSVNGALTPVPADTTNNYLNEAVAINLRTTPRGPRPAVQLAGGPQLAAYTGPQPDNLGVPGISVLSSLSALTGGQAPYGLLNPFYERLLTSAEKPTKDYVTYIGQKNTSTFFTCWMGNNDVLAYATNGGVVDNVAPGVPNPFGALTDTTRFGIGYRAILRTVSRNGTVPGVVANIPNVTTIPYFNTVTVAAVAASFKAANPASPGVFIQAGSTVRLATAADLLTLTAQGYIAAVVKAGGTTPGSLPTSPLPNKYVLDSDEINNSTTGVIARTNQLNAIIAKTARQNKVALADMNTFFTTIGQQGFVTNAVNNSTTFASGNLFSLDGVHPTPRGYAVVANEFIRVINGFYGASVPTVNPNNYRGVVFPQ